MKKYKKKFCRFERIMHFFTISLLILSPVLSVYAKSTLSKVNYEVESKKEEIAIEKKSNESLQMKINELASLENLEEVAKKAGLSYTGNNVKVVE